MGDSADDARNEIELYRETTAEANQWIELRLCGRNR